MLRLHFMNKAVPVGIFVTAAFLPSDLRRLTPFDLTRGSCSSNPASLPGGVLPLVSLPSLSPAENRDGLPLDYPDPLPWLLGVQAHDRSSYLA